MITVDAREAGLGKTRTLIYPLIQQHHAQGTRCLIVVPSKHLQHQYARDLPGIVRIINSDTGNVWDQYLECWETQNIVCVTQQAFLLWPILKHEIWQNCSVIFDEAFSPLIHTEIRTTRDSGKAECDFKFREIFEFQVDPEAHDPDKLLPVQIRKYRTQSTLLSTQIAELQTPNFHREITKESYLALCENRLERVWIHGRLDTEIFRVFRNIHIAAANFSRTCLALYLRAQGIAYEVLHEFQKHQATQAQIHMHYPVWQHNAQAVNLTGYQKAQSPGLIAEFQQACKSRLQGQAYLCLRNRADRIITGGIEIQSNSQGLNQYSTYQNIMITQAQRPHKQVASYIRRCLKLQDQNQAYTLWAEHTGYQAIMRLAHRHPEFTGEIHCYLADGVTALEIMQHYFTNMIPHVLEISPPEKKPRKPALSPAERTRKHRARKRALINDTIFGDLS